MKQASVGEGPGPRSGMHVRSVEIHVLRYAMSGARRPTQAYATRGRRSACFPLIAAKLFSNRSTGRGRTSVNVAPQSACGAWSMPTRARPHTHAGTGDGVSGVTASSLCMLAVSKQMQPTPVRLERRGRSISGTPMAVIRRAHAHTERWPDQVLATHLRRRRRQPGSMPYANLATKFWRPVPVPMAACGG